jgi:hypothetical protein
MPKYVLAILKLVGWAAYFAGYSGYLEGRPEPIRQTDNDYTLTVHEYVGGGRHETTCFRNLSKKRV